MLVERAAEALDWEMEAAKALGIDCTGEELHADVARETEEVGRRYDCMGIGTVVAIEPWGRSGSVLLASYFDGHDGVMALPALRSNGIYVYFAANPTLSLREKLIAYPAFNELTDPQSEAAGCGRSLFEGPFAIDRRRYLVATLAVSALYDTLPQEFAQSGRGFFVALHVVFDRALGRRPSTPTPLIVCAQHETDNPTAAHLLEEFPNARFIHTVRDPITSVDRLFDWFFDPNLLSSRQPTAAERAAREGSARYISVLAPWMALSVILDADRPHPGSVQQKRLVRFEDLHRKTADTMRELAGYLGIDFSPALLASTFAGRSYVVNRDGKSWAGARREPLMRSDKNLSCIDRGLIYALFYENFRAWGYPYPKAFDRWMVRLLAILAALLCPTRMEWVVARAAWRKRIWPWLKRGQWRTPVDTMARLAYSRAAICWLVMRAIPQRLFRRTHPLELDGARDSPFGGRQS